MYLLMQHTHHNTLCFSLMARLQEARLVALRDLLRQRDEAQKEVTRERLTKIYSKLQKDQDTKQQKIHNDYIRCKATAFTLR